MKKLLTILLLFIGIYASAQNQRWQNVHASGFLKVGDTITTNAYTDTLWGFGYSIMLGLPGPANVVQRYFTQIAQARGSIELNKAISGTTLVQLSAGDSSMENRLNNNALPTYNYRYTGIVFEYTVNDARLLNPVTDTSRYRIVWDSVFNKLTSLGWPMGKVVIISSSLVGTAFGNQTTNFSPGSANEITFGTIAKNEAIKFGAKYFDGYTYALQNAGYPVVYSDSLHLTQYGHNIVARGLLTVMDSITFLRSNNLIVEKTLNVNTTTNLNGTVNVNTNLNVSGDALISGNYALKLKATNDYKLTASSALPGDGNDKIHIWENGTTKFGIGMNQIAGAGYFLNLYFPTTATYGFNVGTMSTSNGTTYTPLFTIQTASVTMPSAQLPTGANTDSVVVETTVSGVMQLKKVAQSSIGGSAVPGGSTSQVQFNSSGAFSGSANHTWDSVNNILRVQNAPGAAYGDGIQIFNTAAATNGNAKYSPSLHFQAQGWGTTASASQLNDFRITAFSTQSTVAYGDLVISYQNNGGGYNTIADFSSQSGGSGFLAVGVSAATNYNSSQLQTAILNATGAIWGSSTSASTGWRALESGGITYFDEETSSGAFQFRTNHAANTDLYLFPNSNVAIGGSTTDSAAFIQANASTATNASIWLKPGVAMTTYKSGSLTWDGTHLYFGTAYNTKVDLLAPTLQAVMSSGSTLTTAQNLNFGSNILTLTGSSILTYKNGSASFGSIIGGAAGTYTWQFGYLTNGTALTNGGLTLDSNNNLTTSSYISSPNFQPTSTKTVVSGSTSGTSSFTEPEQGSSEKRVIIYLNALNGTASYTFPTAFINTPVVVTTNGLSSSIVTSLTTSAVTVTGTTTTGYIIITGF